MAKQHVIQISGAILIALLSCNNQAGRQTIQQPEYELTWQQTVFDYGTIEQGDSVAFTFHFTNTGQKPIQLGTPYPSCGCLRVHAPGQTISHGQAKEIQVIFNSTGKKGIQHKNVVIHSKAGQTVLKINGVVSASDD